MVLPKEDHLDCVSSSVNNNTEDCLYTKKRVVEGRDGVLIVDPENNPKIIEAVNEIREKLLQEYEENAHLYIEKDIEMISTCDYYIRRFLYPHDLNASAAYEQTRQWLAWRKDEGFQDATDQRFPREFYQIGACFRYLPDKDGTLLMYCRFKVSNVANVYTLQVSPIPGEKFHCHMLICCHLSRDESSLLAS